jgi:hypothetical protein
LFGQVSQIEKTYSCVNIKTSPSSNSSQPVAHFSSLDSYINFMSGRLINREPQILNIGLVKYYVCHWPTSNIQESYYDSNIGTFKQTKDTMYEGLKSAVDAGLTDTTLSIEFKIKIEDTESKGKTPGVTPTPSPVPPNPGFTCPPAIITSFSPTIGKIDTIVQINGSNFETTKEIKIGTTVIPFSGVTILNSGTIRFTLPQVGEGVIIQEKISLTTDYGTTTSINNFTYDPTMVAIPTSAQPTIAQGPSASIPPEIVPGIPNGNNQPQETGPPVLTGITTTNLLGSDTSLRVNVNPEAGPWKIIPSFMTWRWRAVGIKAGPNNTFEEVEIGARSDSRQLEGYVSTDGKSFFVTDFDIVDIISEDLDNPDDIKNVNRIYNQMVFTYNHDDAYVKFNETNNPKDVIEQGFRDFHFTIILK